MDTKQTPGFTEQNTSGQSLDLVAYFIACTLLILSSMGIRTHALKSGRHTTTILTFTSIQSVLTDSEMSTAFTRPNVFLTRNVR